MKILLTGFFLITISPVWTSIVFSQPLSLNIIFNPEQGKTLYLTSYTDAGMVEINLKPTSFVTLFAEYVISTRYNQRDFVLSPSGEELFYTLSHPRGFSVILHSKKINGLWTRPEVASFSGLYNDFEPTFSADGNQVYFSSSRPNTYHPDGGVTRIWVVHKEENGTWGNPDYIHIPVPENTHLFSPTIARNGNLYFNASLPNGIGREDIWMSRKSNGEYSKPEVLSTAVNSPMSEFNAFVCPDEEFLIFTSWGREDDIGRGDLYISFKNEDNDWSPLIHLGDKINSTGIDYNPFVSADKKVFFFTSDRFDHTIFGKDKIDRNEFEKRVDSVLNGSTNIYFIDFGEVLKFQNTNIIHD